MQNELQTTKERDEQIEKIISSFDWKIVHKAMTAVNWRWSTCEYGVPKIGDLVNIAIMLLKDAWDNGCSSVRTGGFEASLQDGVLFLEFCLEHKNAGDL